MLNKNVKHKSAVTDYADRHWEIGSERKWWIERKTGVRVGYQKPSGLGRRYLLRIATGETTY